MPSVQSLGVGSGLDVSTIITQLMALERQPLARMEQAEKGIQTQISAYGTIQSKLSALDSAMSNLSRASTWQSTTVDSHGRTEVEVTASSTTQPTSLDVAVSQLAQRQSISTLAFADSAAVVGTGTLSITLGSWDAPVDASDPTGPTFGNFTPVSGAAAIDITISSPANTLADVRDAINDADAGVEAQILTDANGARLVIRSTNTGAGAGFQITTSGSTSDFDALKFTGQSASASNAGALGNQQGANLRATLNGVAIESTTNTLSNVLDGITIRATQTTSTAVQVDIEADQASIQTHIDSLVSAYNDTVSYLKQVTAYNEATKTGGPLQGDQVTLSLLNQLRGAMTRVTSASSVFDRLSDIGITLQRDGSLSVASGTLQTAMSDSLSEVQALFARDDSDSNSDGLALSVATFIDSLTEEGGLIASKDDTLQARLKRNQSEQDKMSQRLEAVQARLESTYSALDTKMATMNSLSSYVSQQITAMNSSNSD